MSTSSVQIKFKYNLFSQLLGRLERVPCSSREGKIKEAQRQRARSQGGRYTGWDFPEMPFHDLKAKMK
jgi:hypothetical protein